MRVEREVAFVAVIGGKGAGKSVQIQKNAAYMKIDLRSNVKKWTKLLKKGLPFSRPRPGCL